MHCGCCSCPLPNATATAALTNAPLCHRPFATGPFSTPAAAATAPFTAITTTTHASAHLGQNGHRVGPLHLYRHVDALMCRRAVDLPERRDRDGLWRDCREQRRRARRVVIVCADAGRHRPTPLERLLEDGPREVVFVRHVGRLQPLERGRRLVSDQIGPLRQRLRNLDRAAHARNGHSTRVALRLVTAAVRV